MSPRSECMRERSKFIGELAGRVAQCAAVGLWLLASAALADPIVINFDDLTGDMPIPVVGALAGYGVPVFVDYNVVVAGRDPRLRGIESSGRPSSNGCW